MAAERRVETGQSTMHTYSTDNDLRLRIAAGLGIVSYFIVEWFPWLSRQVNKVIPFVLDTTAPTIGLTLTLCTVVFAKWMWTWQPVRAVGLVEVPDLTGEWNGEIRSSHNEDSRNSPHSTDVSATIEQSWRKITIEFDTNNSQSYSLGASFITAHSDPQVHYHYENVPKYHAPDGMSIHRGSAELQYIERQEESDKLVGRYYTGRGRQNYGQIELTRD